VPTARSGFLPRLCSVTIGHARCGQIPAGRPRGVAQLHRAASGRGQGAGDPDREAPASAGRAPRAPVWRLLRDGRATATCPGNQRDRSGRDDRADEAAGCRREGQTEAPSDPRSYPADGSGTDPGCRGLCRLRRAPAPDRGGRHGRAGIRPRPVHREPDRPSSADLRLLRALRPGPAAIAPDRARPPRPGPSGPCAGQQVGGDRGPGGAA
jgi:hypothetical protein